jgi:hypothetical protein
VARLDHKLKLVNSTKLIEFMNRLPKDARFKITEDTMSSWIEVDVFGRYGWVQFAIWKATDQLYALDKHGAAGDDPIAIAAAVKRVDLIPKHRREA